MRRAVAFLSAIVLATLATPLAARADAAHSDADASNVTGSQTAAATARGPSPTVSVSIDSVTPQVPQPTYQLHTLRVELTVQNLTDQPLHQVGIVGLRAESYAVRSVDGLERVIAHPPTTGLPVPSTRPVTVSLGPAGSATAIAPVQFETTVGLPTTAGFCLCDPHALVPLLLQARDPADHVLGSTAAFVPSFYPQPAKISVGWVWPLIDRPHRLTRTGDFLDDDLATSIATGRLARCLAVLEQIAPHVPVTVVIDPELLDELQIMATTQYRYFDSANKLVPGSGSAAARQWLARLQKVLQNNPSVTVALTPPADPDVESLATAGLSWTNALPTAMQQRVSAALGGLSASTDFAWPPSDVIGRSALSALYGSGYRSLLLSSTAVRHDTGPAGLPVTLAQLPNAKHPVNVALTSPLLQSNAAAAMTLDHPGQNLSTLLARITARLVQRPNSTGQTVVLAAPRYVDPAVPQAVTAIRDTSHSAITTPANVLDLLSTATPGADGTGPRALRDQLAPPAAGSAPVGLPPANLHIAHGSSTRLASLRSMFRDSTAALDRLAGLQSAVQRIESAAWRARVGVGGRPAGAALARELRDQVHGLVRGVHIITPPSRSYTLASTNSPLLVTVENDLNYPASVQVSIRTVNGVPGLDAGLSDVQDVQPHSKALLHVPTQVQRSGRIQVRAVLLTPTGDQLGAPVPLTVNSTALGTIGVVITFVAGAVLVLALLVRLVRRLILRRRRPPTATPWLDDDPDRPAPTQPAGRGGSSRTPATVPPPPATP